MFPIFCGLNSCFFCLLYAWNFLSFPFSFSFDQSKLMVDDHINDFVCIALVEKIGAESYHLVVANDLYQLLPHSQQNNPNLLFPARKCSLSTSNHHSHFQSMIEFFNPAIYNTLSESKTPSVTYQSV